jgi:hypothetical protein
MKNLEEKARLLSLILEKHNPEELKALSMRLLNSPKETTQGEVKRICSALYELMDVLK